MRNIFLLLFLYVLLQSCKSCYYSHCDKDYKLTDEQKAFLYSVNKGDQVMWQSSIGLIDTAIIQEATSYIYPVSTHRYEESASITARYQYKFIGKRKTKAVMGIYVDPYEQSTAPGFLGTGVLDSVIHTQAYNNSEYKSLEQFRVSGMSWSKRIGGTTYQNVYWRTGPAITDTTFWNNKGLLGYTIAGETLVKIK